jgi:hypothetical protein
MRRRPRRGLMLILLVVATAVGCAAGNAKEGLPGAEADVRLFASELERIHPNPYHATPREEYAVVSTSSRRELVRSTATSSW